jgi:hypothetical protein
MNKISSKPGKFFKKFDKALVLKILIFDKSVYNTSWPWKSEELVWYTPAIQAGQHTADIPRQLGPDLCAGLRIYVGISTLCSLGMVTRT